jgi:hypothetical protein
MPLTANANLANNMIQLGEMVLRKNAGQAEISSTSASRGPKRFDYSNQRAFTYPSGKWGFR